MILVGSIVVSCLVLSALLTRWVRDYALQRDIVDRPNARALHDVPVARGGGAAILIAASACLVVLMLAGSLPPRLGAPWVACGLGFGLLGWVDDHVDLSAAVRIVCQMALAVAFCLTLPGIVPFDPVGLVFVSGGAIALVWMVNLYNFMDGADGFAALEAVAVAAAGGVILGVAGAEEQMLIAALVAGSSAGFLIWNWAPARIFMGDVGSYFLGFQFGALILHGAIAGTGAWVWLILIAPFVTDASLTLIRRMWKREKWWQAHRTHLYQRLILGGWNHPMVCAGLLIITLVLLAPAAVLTARYPSLAPGTTVTIYVLTAIIWAAIDSKMSQSA